MGGLATTSSVGSSFSSPFDCDQRNTRSCALMEVVPSLRSLSTAATPGAGTSTVTGETCSDAAQAGTDIVAEIDETAVAVSKKVSLCMEHFPLDFNRLPEW